METLLVSACLLGFDCKYSGGNNALPEEELALLRSRYHLIPVCPEVAGGLPIPREPSERHGDRVVNRRGEDVTAQFRRGAEIACLLARRFGAKQALLKSNSPSCGSSHIYDGSFSGILIRGEGVTTEYLKYGNIRIYENLKELESIMI